MTGVHLNRLREVRDVLVARGKAEPDLRLACYSAFGFDGDLHRAEADGEVVLVDLKRLYHGN